MIGFADETTAGRLLGERAQGAAVRQRVESGDGRGQDGLRGEWVMSERGTAGQVRTTRPPASRWRWNETAS